MVECSIELVPVPPGTSGGQRTQTLDFSAVDSFDTLHGPSPKLSVLRPRGEVDPIRPRCRLRTATLRDSAILGAETWETFRSRVVTIHARLLVPRERGASMSNPPPAPAAPASFQPSVANQFAVMMGLQPHAPPSQPPSGMDQSMLAGLQWAAAAGMEPPMAMMMMMAAGGGTWARGEQCALRRRRKPPAQASRGRRCGSDARRCTSRRVFPRPKTRKREPGGHETSSALDSFVASTILYPYVCSSFPQSSGCARARYSNAELDLCNIANQFNES